ncbi:hypothetical protein Apau_1819 [Aminomonas paucivorans DSM 12260]|uniref:SGNH hydrolase-type esterase domain-containing protein n=1 Tax=Aminomonas paucivorans DSM 12260 TaxID=584708 RepID=E3CVY0_9BACT|nr:hypothetical protein Apau_1819 [Aminomonas paucivorans DSM 12260]
MPRKGMPVQDTWVYQFLQKVGSNGVAYTYLRRGLTTNDVVLDLNDLFCEFSPDFAVVQVGICDCSKRIVGKRLEFLLFRVPLVGFIYKKIRKKFSYTLTKIFGTRYVEIDKFKKNISKIVDICVCKGIRLCLLGICPPGGYIKSMVHGISEDISLYNGTIDTITQLNENCEYINPYLMHEDDILTIEDGHHLTKLGHLLVYNAISLYFDSIAVARSDGKSDNR